MKNDAANDQTAQDLVDNIFGGIPKETPREPVQAIAESDLYDRVTKDAAEIITNGLDAISSLKLRVGAGAEAGLIEAYSTLITSTTAAIEVLNKIQMQTKKAKDAEALEKLRNEHKLQQIEQKAKLTNVDGPQVNNNIMIATREDIMQSLLKPLQDQARIMISNERVIEAEIIASEAKELEEINQKLAK